MNQSIMFNTVHTHICSSLAFVDVNSVTHNISCQHEELHDCVETITGDG